MFTLYLLKARWDVAGAGASPRLRHQANLFSRIFNPLRAAEVLYFSVVLPAAGRPFSVS